MQKSYQCRQKAYLIQCPNTPHALFHIEGAKNFKKKEQLQGRLKQLNLEQDPGHNTG